MTSYVIINASFTFKLLMPNPQREQLKQFWTRRLDRVAAYDSFYLAVAETLGCEFWTADRRLVNAAQQTWVRLAGVD